MVANPLAQFPLQANLIIIIISLFVVYKSAGFLIHAAAKFGRRLGFSDAWLGLIIISTVASFPVMLSSITGLFLDDVEFLIGSILGTNLFNIGIVIGTLGLFTKTKIGKSKVFEKSFFMIWGIIMLPLFLLLDGFLSRIDGIVLLIVFFYYLRYIWKAEGSLGKLKKDIPLASFWKEALTFIFAFTALLLSTRWLVFSSLILSNNYNIPSFITAITVIAFGSALPSFAIQYNASRKRHESITTGSVLGSLVITFVLYFGLVGLFFPIAIEPSKLLFASAFMLFSLSLVLNTLRKRNLTKRTSLILLILYFAFIGAEIIRSFL